MKKSQSFVLGLIGLIAAACGSAAAEPQTPSSEDSAATAPAQADSSGSEVPEHAPALAQKVAEMTAEAWDGQRAKAEEVMLSIRIRVDAHPIMLKTNGEGVAIVTGEDGAHGGDADADLSIEQAQKIVRGEATLKQLVESGEAQSNNMDGLKRFAEFLKN